MNFSVAILTLNEENNIIEAVKSIKGCDDIVVLDSFSSDSTVEKARQVGCRVFQRVFDNFAAQRNYLLENVEFKHNWVFFLDADERFTEPLLNECNSAAQADIYSAYYAAPKVIFLGRWIRHASQYPVYQVRFMRKDEARFEQYGHGQKEGQATRGIGRLKEPYLHYIMSKGIDDWIEKHKKYAREEARAILTNDVPFWQSAREVLTADSILRRRALKRLAGNCPFRPFFRFVYLYFFCFGILDGLAGWEYCRLMTMYEKMILCCLSEMKDNK